MHSRGSSFRGVRGTGAACGRVRVPNTRKGQTMNRNRTTSLGVIAGGLVLAAGALASVTPASGATPSPTDLQTTAQAVQNTATAAVGQATGSSVPTAPTPASAAVPITALSNEIGGTLLPGQSSITGSNATGQSSPVANADAPVNACSVSVGALADSSSSCSTTSVGVEQPGGLADANVPITAQDNAVGLLNQEASAFGLTDNGSASTAQEGALNADAPVTVCSVNVGLVGNTTSDCDTAGSSGPAAQTGVVDAAVPVTVCDVIAEIDGDSSSELPTAVRPHHTAGSGSRRLCPDHCLRRRRRSRRLVQRHVHARRRGPSDQRPAHQ